MDGRLTTAFVSSTFAILTHQRNTSTAVTFALAAAIDSTLAAAVRMSLLAVAGVVSASAVSLAGDDSEAAVSG